MEIIQSIQSALSSIFSHLLLVIHAPSVMSEMASEHLAFGPKTNSVVALVAAIICVAVWYRGGHLTKVVRLISKTISFVPVVGSLMGLLCALFMWLALFQVVHGIAATGYVAACVLLATTILINAPAIFARVRPQPSTTNSHQ